jgi:hypothetical protein
MHQQMNRWNIAVALLVGAGVGEADDLSLNCTSLFTSW